MMVSREMWLFILIVLLTACGKETESSDPIVSNRICITAKHHEVVMPGLTVYLLFDHPGFPGFDHLDTFDTAIILDENGYACYDNPPIGKHWAVALGYDPSIQDSVKGATSVWIESIVQSVDTIVYVTEIH